MTDVSELRALAEAATPGPWDTRAERMRPRAIVVAGTEQVADAAEHVHWTDAQCERNAAFIAAANPSAILSLLDRLAALEAETKRLRQGIEAEAHETCESADGFMRASVVAVEDGGREVAARQQIIAHREYEHAARLFARLGDHDKERACYARADAVRTNTWKDPAGDEARISTLRKAGTP